MGEGNSFSLLVCPQGVPNLARSKVPTPPGQVRTGGGVPQGTFHPPRYLPPRQVRMGGTPRYLPQWPRYLPPWPRYLPPLSQVRPGEEGVPHGTYPLSPRPVRTGEGVPQGTYPPAKVPTPQPVRTGERGYPKVPTPLPGQGLATRQEDFLVKSISEMSINISHCAKKFNLV